MMEKDYSQQTLTNGFESTLLNPWQDNLSRLSSIPASGHGYGNSCCKYNGKKARDCTFYPTKHELRIEWSMD